MTKEEKKKSILKCAHKNLFLFPAYSDQLLIYFKSIPIGNLIMILLFDYSVKRQ